MSKVKTLMVAGLLLITGIPMAAWAVPPTIPYQGRLTDAAGTPLNGSYSIRFSLWDAASAGSELWNETQATVTVANGLFDVNLGSVTAIPASIITGGALFLEIKVGSDPAMTPRQRVGSTVYAFRSGIVPAVASSSGTVITANGVQDLSTITATFPAAGYAVVTGFADAGSSNGGGTVCYGLSINTTSATRGANENFHCTPATGYTETSLVTQNVFSVAPGATTFYLVGFEQLGNWTVFWNRITVEYFPDAVGSVTQPPTPQGVESGSGPGHSQDK